MLAGFLLSLREGTEAALVVGIVLGTLAQLGRSDCARVVWAGVGAAVGISLVAAGVFQWFGLAAAASAEPIFEGLMLLAAAGLLTWMLSWMSRQVQRQRADITADVKVAVCSPGGQGLFLLTFVAIVREGIELAFFLTAVSVGEKPAGVFGGGALGLGAAALLAWVLFATAIRLNVRRFFQFTSLALVFFAAGLVAKAMAEFNESGWIPGIIDPLWNSHAILNDGSVLGEMTKVLLGYTSTPSLTVVIGYTAYLTMVCGWTVWRRPGKQRIQSGFAVPSA